MILKFINQLLIVCLEPNSTFKRLHLYYTICIRFGFSGCESIRWISHASVQSLFAFPRAFCVLFCKQIGSHKVCFFPQIPICFLHLQFYFMSFFASLWFVVDVLSERFSHNCNYAHLISMFCTHFFLDVSFIWTLKCEEKKRRKLPKWKLFLEKEIECLTVWYVVCLSAAFRFLYFISEPFLFITHRTSGW